jgi:hypothetical protein
VTTHRAVAVVLAASLVVVGLAFAGNWERDRRADEEVRGMAQVLALVGPLDGPTLNAFRYFQDFQCLAYRRDRNRLALELCVDAEGRVVEAIDRRSGEPKIWSLRDDPTRSNVLVDRGEVDRLLDRMTVYADPVREPAPEGTEP